MKNTNRPDWLLYLYTWSPGVSGSLKQIPLSLYYVNLRLSKEHWEFYGIPPTGCFLLEKVNSENIVVKAIRGFVSEWKPQNETDWE